MNMVYLEGMNKKIKLIKLNKRNFTQAIIVLGLMLCLVFALTVCKKDKGTIKIGVRGDIPGFAYHIEGSGRLYGYEIDFCSLLMKKLGYSDIEYVLVDANDREKALDNGDVDLLMANYSFTEERAANYALSDPYYTDNLFYIVEKSSCIDDISSLSKIVVGVKSDSSTEEIINKTFKEDFDGELSIVSLDSYDLLMDNLDAGLVDIVAMDYIIYYQYISDEYDCFVSDNPECISNICVAAKKDDPIIDDINIAISELRKQGVFDELYDKWYGGGTVYEQED